MKHFLIFTFFMTFIMSSCDDKSMLSEQNSGISTTHSFSNVNALSSDRINNIGHTQFEVECLEEGLYYLCVLVRIPIINGSLHEYEVEINGIINENTLKPSIGGLQSLYITDKNKTPSLIQLKKGINTISIVSTSKRTIKIEQLKISSNVLDAKIDDSVYRDFLNKVKNNSNFNKEKSAAYTTSLQSEEIYDYALNLIAPHTYDECYDPWPEGIHLTLTTTCNIPHVIEVYEQDKKGNVWSWAASGTSSAFLEMVTPRWGFYNIRIRALNPGTIGTANIIYRDSEDNFTGMIEDRDVLVGGSTLPINRNLSGKIYMVTHTLNDAGGVPLSLIDENFKVIKRTHFLRTYPNPPYEFNIYDHTSFLEYEGPSSYIFVYTTNPVVPERCADIYLGLDFSSSQIRSLFPNLPSNNSFKSGLMSPIYNCISWSVERTDYWEWPGDRGSSYYHPNLLTAFDKLYAAYGYTRSGATADNAGIALWALNGEYTHASIRKNANTKKPHGFEWESKCGSLERVMHTRDALDGKSYGKIAHYYKPTSNVYSISQAITKDTVNTLSLKNRISLKASLPSRKITEFEEAYSAWKKTWNNIAVAVYSNPRKYAESKEYAALLKVCTEMDKASWPLFIEKLADGDIFSINLIKDLTFTDNIKLMDEAKQNTLSKIGNGPLPSMYSNYINYCIKLLDSNKREIQESIIKE